MPQTDNQSALTPEQLKELKREKTRKNIRIIGIGLALYYFISAGLSWYEDSKIKETQLISTDEFVLSDSQFNEAYRKSASLWQTTAPAVTVSDNKVIYTTGTQNVQVECSFDNSKLEKATVSLTYPKTVSTSQLKEVRSFLGAVENTSDSEKINKLVNRLGFDEQSADQIFTEGSLSTEHISYTVSFRDGEPRQLSICAETETFRR